MHLHLSEYLVYPIPTVVSDSGCQCSPSDFEASFPKTWCGPRFLTHRPLRPRLVPDTHKEKIVSSFTTRFIQDMYLAVSWVLLLVLRVDVFFLPWWNSHHVGNSFVVFVWIVLRRLIFETLLRIWVANSTREAACDWRMRFGPLLSSSRAKSEEFCCCDISFIIAL